MKNMSYEDFMRRVNAIDLCAFEIGKDNNIRASIEGHNCQTLTLRGEKIKILAEILANPVPKGDGIAEAKVKTFREFSDPLKGKRYFSVRGMLAADTASTIDIRVAEGTYMVKYEGKPNKICDLSLATHNSGKIIYIPLEDDESIRIAKTRFFACDDKVKNLKLELIDDFNIMIHSKTDGVFTKVTGGNVFCEADGDCRVLILNPKEKVHIWPGHLVAFTSNAKINMTTTSSDPLYQEKKGYFDVEITGANYGITLVFVQTGSWLGK